MVFGSIYSNSVVFRVYTLWYIYGRIAGKYWPPKYVELVWYALSPFSVSGLPVPIYDKEEEKKMRKEQKFICCPRCEKEIVHDVIGENKIVGGGNEKCPCGAIIWIPYGNIPQREEPFAVFIFI